MRYAMNQCGDCLKNNIKPQNLLHFVHIPPTLKTPCSNRPSSNRLIMASVPFDPPKLVTARRSHGFVDIPEDKDPVEEEWNGRRSSINFGNGSSSQTSPLDNSKNFGPTHLQRKKTMGGNILIFEPDGEPPQAFWLQRKTGKSSHGEIRIGYKLRRNTKPSFKDTAEAWELDVDEAGEPSLFKFLIMHSSVLEMNSDNHDVQSPLHMLSALQMIAQNNNANDSHVAGAHLLGACRSFVYAVIPYYPDGTLLQFCMSNGPLEEPVARFLFRQILKGLKSLQESGLCHRNLSLDVMKLHGDQASIDRLDWCMRFNKNAPVDEDKALPLPGGTNPQYVAPEYFGCLTGAWDGFAADLWSSALMLYSMAVGIEALFVAPLQEDKTFLELCVNGNVGDCVEKYAKSIGREIVLSDKLVNLLENMLRADPKQRYTLEEVIDHPWVKSEEVMPPSVWEENLKAESSSETADAKE